MDLICAEFSCAVISFILCVASSISWVNVVNRSFKTKLSLSNVYRIIGTYERENSKKNLQPEFQTHLQFRHENFNLFILPLQSIVVIGTFGHVYVLKMRKKKQSWTLFYKKFCKKISLSLCMLQGKLTLDKSVVPCFKSEVSHSIIQNETHFYNIVLQQRIKTPFDLSVISTNFTFLFTLSRLTFQRGDSLF